MRNHITVLAGALIIIFTVFGCSNSSKVTAPQSSQVRTSITPQQSSRLSITYPNPISGILGTSPEGCHVIYFDQKHFVVLDIGSVRDLPFQITDGLNVVVYGSYMPYQINPCGGPLFQVTSMRSLEPTSHTPGIVNNGFGE